jgi:hypothetical protein
MAEFVSERSWLREASLQRVNTMLMNKRELPEHGTVLREDISLRNIDASGLSVSECFHISQWAYGLESGRHCLFALMEFRRIQSHTKTVAEADAQTSDGHGNSSGKDSSAAFDMIRRSINLPGNVFSESGALQETLFWRSPNVVLKETLKTLASVAMEKGAMSLNAEQLNLAMKQLRVRTIGGSSDSGSGSGSGSGKQAADQKADPDAEAPTDENVENEKNVNDVAPDVRKGKKTHKNSLEGYRLQILLELIRVYVKQSSAAAVAAARAEAGLDPFGSKSPPSEEETKDESEEAETVAVSEADLLKHHETLEKHLSLSLEGVAESSDKAEIDEIERDNSVLLSYIRQITAMRGSLETQLKDFESSRAFLSLGLSKDATTEQIRKAYHAKAIKLHPDKKGGNTEKFQKLQVMYQDLVKQRELENSCRAKNFPEAEQDARLAQEAVAEMEGHLSAIKEATVMCGTLGHLNIKWVKKLETYPSMVFPKNITKLTKYVLKNLESASDLSAPENLDVLQTDLTVQACSARYLVKPMNLICDSLQKLLASGVTLVSVGRYGKEASNRKAYLQLLEQAVGVGLSISEHVKDIDSVEAQVLACVERIIDVQNTLMVSKYQVMEFTTANVLIEMAITVFRSRSITVNMIAELAVMAAVLAADLCSAAQEIVEKVDIELAEEIRKKSNDAANMEKENDYNEEDLATLVKVKEQRMKEDRAEDAVRCKAQEVRREEEKAQEEAAEDIMEHLSGKIKQLHVQLKMQYVQTLQKVNTDACQYQKKLLKPLLSEFGAVSDTTTSHDSAPATAAVHIPPSASTGIRYDGAEEKDRVRVLSFLADFIDRSCLRFKDALLAQREADALHVVRQEVGIPDEGYERCSLWDHLNAHIGWMSALDRTTSPPAAKEEEQPSAEAEAEADAAETDGDSAPGEPAREEEGKEEEDASEKESGAKPVESSTSVVPKKQLAFYPDYRSRVLYLSVLLDAQTVSTIVERELQPRLKEILLPGNLKKQDEEQNAEMENTADLTASLFCALVTQGINTIKKDQLV